VAARFALLHCVRPTAPGRGQGAIFARYDDARKGSRGTAASCLDGRRGPGPLQHRRVGRWVFRHRRPGPRRGEARQAGPHPHARPVRDRQRPGSPGRPAACPPAILRHPAIADRVACLAVRKRHQ
jgi:hypothetical protein